MITKEEFEELKSHMQELLGDRGKRLDDIEKSQVEHGKRLDDLSKAFGDLKAHVAEASAAINKRVDTVEEKSKSLFTRIKEAMEPVGPE